MAGLESSVLHGFDEDTVAGRIPARTKEHHDVLLLVTKIQEGFYQFAELIIIGRLRDTSPEDDAVDLDIVPLQGYRVPAVVGVVIRSFRPQHLSVARRTWTGTPAKGIVSGGLRGNRLRSGIV